MNYARAAAAISKSFAVFPSTEAVLLEARGGAFAGCISATANLNADLCAARLAQGRHGRARCRGHHPQAVRRQAAGLRRQGAARAYPWRSGAGAGASRRSRRSRPPTAPRSSPATTRCAPSASRDAAFGGVDARGRPHYKPRLGGEPDRRRIFLRIRRLGGHSRRAPLQTRVSWPIPSPPAKPRARSRAGPKSTKARRVGAAQFGAQGRGSDRHAATAPPPLAALKAAEPVIMRAAQRGVVHKNNASRKVSRLAHRVAKLGK